MSNRKFSFKTFTSFILVWTFLLLFISGVMLFVSPPGRVAHWTNWTLLGLTKEGWQGVHTLMAVVFLVGGIFHLLKFNWKVFIHYLATRKKGSSYRFEAVMASVLFVVVLIGTILGIPPFSSFLDFGESVKLSWEEKIGNPPVPHMELKTLAEVSGLLGLSVDEARGQLQARAWDAGKGSSSLQQLADVNGVSPQDIYQALQTKSGSSPSPVPGNLQSIQRTGLGRKSIEDLSAELGFDLRAELNRMGITAENHERWRDVAERAGASPHDLLTRIEAERNQSLEETSSDEGDR